MYVIATVICPNYHFSVSLHVPFLNLHFEQIANFIAYLLAKFRFDTAENEPSKLCPFRPAGGGPRGATGGPPAAVGVSAGDAALPENRREGASARPRHENVSKFLQICIRFRLLKWAYMTLWQ